MEEEKEEVKEVSTKETFSNLNEEELESEKGEF